jgi:HSP20 family protein
MMTLREAMARLFEESLVSPRRREWLAPAEGGPALDVYETEDAVVVKSNVAGVKPDDVDISISGNTLSISGQIKVEEVTEGDYIRRERRYGGFSRSVALPEDVNADEAEAEFEDGILTLTIPKATEAKPKVIKVKGKEEVEHAQGRAPIEKEGDGE